MKRFYQEQIFYVAYLMHSLHGTNSIEFPLYCLDSSSVFYSNIRKMNTYMKKMLIVSIHNKHHCSEEC